jgi:hypothetical protein
MGSIVGKIMGTSKAGKQSAQASDRASQLSADAQREALDYLKETEALPQQFREGALSRLGGMYGIEGGTGDQFDPQKMIDQAKASPLYSSIMGAQDAGEQAILRNASATGGLRSGNVQSNLAEFSGNLQNEALLQSYNQQYNQYNNEVSGLQGLAGMPSNANAIAQGTAGIGNTMAQGITAGAQSQMAAQNMGMSQMLGGLGVAAAFSDIRLKENIHHAGSKDGLNWYSWDWNKEAEALGLVGSETGVMAHELYETNPELVGTRSGYITVNYSQLNRPRSL